MSFDVARLPAGERGWTAFTEWVKTLDDRYERHYLELKGEVDLTQKAGRHKIAKFILAAAHRDPVKARKYFDGRALMVLGVGGDTPPGIGMFEMQDLEADIRSFAGVSGPSWDLHRIPLGGGRDILVVVVEPPTGTIWPTLKDGAGLADGDIYIRVEGASRKAKGPEVRLLLERAMKPAREFDVDVSLAGKVLVARIDADDLRTIATSKVAQLQESWERARSSPQAPFLSPFGLNERRSDEESLDQLANFEQNAHLHPERGELSLAASISDGIHIVLTNANTSFLRDLRVDIEFDQDITAVPWVPRESPTAVLFADAPLPWGTDGYTNAVSDFIPRALPGVMDRRVQIAQDEPARLTVTMAELRPRYEESSDDDDVVLVQFTTPNGDLPDSVSGTWKLTAAGFDEAREGQFTLPVAPYDWVPAIRNIGGLVTE